MLFLHFILSQDLKPSGQDYEMQVVVEQPGESAADLFFKAQKWSVSAYKSANDVTQMADAENGTIILKGTFKVPFMIGVRVIRHTLTIEVKEGRYRATFDGFRQSNPENPSFEFGLNEGMGVKKNVARVEKQCKSILADLKKPCPLRRKMIGSQAYR